MKRSASFFLIAAVALAWLLIKMPTPEFFLAGADGGHQLLGAMQILETGEHPYLDFVATYGPLTFYASAVAQWLSGMRPLGEIVLLTAGFLSGYLLLFSLLRREMGAAAAVPMVFLALLLLPQFYKYYCVVVPMLVLAAAAVYERRRDGPAAAGLGVVVGVAFLYRHDFGFFAGGALVTLMAAPGRRRHLAAAGAGIGGAMAPWLLFLLVRGGLVRYGRMLYDATFSMSRGLALPHPLLHWGNPWLSCAFALWFAVPLAALWVWRQRRSRGEEAGLFVPAACVLAALSFIQSSHRADYYHLCEGLPAACFCLGWLCAGLTPAGGRRLFASTMVLVLMAVVMAQAAPHRFLPGPVLWRVGRKLRYFRADRTTFIRRLLAEEPGFPPAVVVREVRAATRPGERVGIYPFFMKYNYFADRPFAAGMMLLAPGYYDAPAYQRLAVARLEEQRPRFLLWNELFTYDGRPQRNPVRVYPLFRQAVRDDYAPVGRLAAFTVYRRVR